MLIFDSSTLSAGSVSEEHRSERTKEDTFFEKTDHSMELLYADQFSVDYLKEGFKLITVRDSGRYLVVPEAQEGKELSEEIFGELPGEFSGELPEDVTVIRQPLENIYLAATSAMDSFCSLDSADSVTLSGTDEDGWYIEKAKQAMRAGDMIYAGKYSAPDYELILSKNCDLAVESTMIYHTPEVKEQLEQLGIPVLVERSSYESHPLGRMEWIKLYGALLDREEQAEAFFEEQLERLESVLSQSATGKTAAFFYITSNGYVNVRKPGDYVAKMIEMAGGAYVPGEAEKNDNALSTMNMQMEAFYAAAKDADYIIYNSTIDGELKSLDELLAKSSVLADFKAVKEGHVWCTGKNLFQETMGLGDMILDLHRIFTEEDPDEMTYLHRLR
ncbi:MAG: ABC transporter substrate-binding protein [Enterocloster sp.]